MNNKQWTEVMVAKHFAEAINTLKKLPSSRLKGYFSTWPDIIRSPNELASQEKSPVQLRAMPDAISRLEQTFAWMMWLEVDERKLIWKRAAKVGWRSICLEFGYNRATAWRKWKIALQKLANKLNG